VLPLKHKAARRDASTNSKSFGPSGHQELNLYGFVYIRYAALPPAGTVIIVSVYGGWVKTPVLCFGIWHSFSHAESRPRIRSLTPRIFRGENPTNFRNALANLAHFATCRKFWLSSVCWPPCAKLGDAVECRIYGGWVKLGSYF